MIEVRGDDVDSWSDTLLEAGALSVNAEDADADSGAEQPLFGEPGAEAPRQGWSRTRLTALLPGGQDASELLQHCAQQLGRPHPPVLEVRAVDDRDWVRETQQQFGPIDIGERLRIVPSWHLPDAQRAQPAAADLQARVQIVLDPGLAFGTGSHPTTRLCLQWLDRHLRAGDAVIDYGCGSGILAIAAARLGASSVFAVDIDAQALDAARTNAAANGVAISLRSTEDPPPPAANVVLANILAQPLKVLAPLLCSLVRSGGALVLAGVLERQVDEVAQAYEHACGLQLRTVETADGWACLAARKNG
ncbi:MAG TPA: 50S ribosomal protein L11 methyltransferase [Burkholderiaceae bacterium]|nr:50S ribosomal protein L11 methyltransferase [Burkholderiaceae bacterium]